MVYTVVPRARTREQLNGRGEVCAQGARTFRFGTTQLYFSARVQQCSAHAAKQYGQIVSFSFFFYLTGQTGNPPATDSFLVSRPVDAHLAAIPLLCTPKLLSQKGPVEPITVCAIDFRLAA